METLRLILLALHILGLAAIIGAFLVQIRRKVDLQFGWILAGAITQLVTGLALVGVRQASDLDVDNAKIAVKLVLALIVLAAAIAAVVVQRRARSAGTSDRVALPWLHTAGAGAIANTLVAVLWT